MGANEKTAKTIGVIADLATGGIPKNPLDVAGAVLTVGGWVGGNHSGNVKKPVTDHTATASKKPKTPQKEYKQIVFKQD